MKIFAITTIILTALTSVVSAGPAEDAIGAVNNTFEEAFNRGDSAALMDLYTADAAAFPPSAPRADGRPAIGQIWQEAIRNGLKDLSLQTVEIMEVGDIAYETGNASFTMPKTGGGMQQGTLKYVVIWQRGTDGTWRLHRDIWN